MKYEHTYLLTDGSYIIETSKSPIPQTGMLDDFFSLTREKGHSKVIINKAHVLKVHTIECEDIINE